MSSQTDRVVVLVDMDCFYCQVEERLDPNLAGKPLAVVQYNAWKGGGIIAVNYPARDRGVTRYMRGDEAKKMCPEIELVRVPTVRGKADLTKYREAGKRVAEVLQTFTSLLQRASVDEAYLDITETVLQRLKNKKEKLIINQLQNTHVVGCNTEDFLYNIYNNELESDCNIKLGMGGVIVEEIRAAVFEKTGYRCSAGIAHNKILAKLACGLHKPNKQTILPQNGIPELYETLPLKKIKNLGGKFGESLSQKLNITYISELAQFSEQDLMKKYDDKTALWLYNVARGIDTEPVTVRLISKSIGCCKKFPGQAALKTVEEVTHWLYELATEISERLEQDLEENNRKAKQIVLSFAQPVGRKDVHSSRTLVLNSYEARKIGDDCFDALKKFTQKSDGSFCLKFLGLSAGKFEDCKNMNSISTFFKPTSNEGESQQGSNVNISDTQVCTNSNNETNSKENSKSICSKSVKTDNRLMKFFNNIKIENKPEKSYNSTENLSEITEYNENDMTTNDDELDFINHSNNEKSIFNKRDKKENSLNKNFQNIEPENRLAELCNIADSFAEINVDDIENDSENSLNIDDTLQTFENIKKVEADCYLETTTEADYNEILKTKLEFPKFASNFGDTSNSFFMKYVQNMNSHTEPVETICHRKETCCSSTINNQNNIDIIEIDNGNFDENSASSSIIVAKECPECGKNIPEEEYISHMDFHMATNLMEEENKLFREQTEKQKLVKSPVKLTKNKAVKRKALAVTGNHSISSYFRSTNKENANNISCPECGKSLDNEELPSHLDFHAAKRLHLELNPVQVAKPNQVVTSNKKQKCTNLNGIVKFLKPVQN